MPFEFRLNWGKFSAREEVSGLGRKGPRDSTPPRLWGLSAPLARTRRPAMPSPRVTPCLAHQGTVRCHSAAIALASDSLPPAFQRKQATFQRKRAIFQRNEAPTMADRLSWQSLQPVGFDAVLQCLALRPMPSSIWTPSVLPFFVHVYDSGGM